MSGSHYFSKIKLIFSVRCRRHPEHADVDSSPRSRWHCNPKDLFGNTGFPGDLVHLTHQMGFRVEHEIRVIRKVVKHFYGPCLICDSQTKYRNRSQGFKIAWLRRQFEPDARKRSIRAVRLGIAPKDRSLASLEALLCESCRVELPKIRRDAVHERDAELRRRAHLRDLYYRRTEADR